MREERKLFLDSLERHALNYWAKRKAYFENTSSGTFSKRGEEMDLARTRLLDASYALGEYDAAVHPGEPT